MDNNKQDKQNEVENSVKNTTQVQKNKKAKNKIAIFLAVFFLFAGIYAVYWFMIASHFIETDDAYINADQNMVTSQISSTVIDLNVKDGQRVSHGFNALTLDNTDYNLALQRAESNLAMNVRKYSTLQLNFAQSQNSLDLHQNELDKIKADFKRDDDSYKAGILSQQNWLNTKHKLEQAKIDTKSAEIALDNAKVQAIAKDIYSHPDVINAINLYKQAYIDLFRTQIIVPVDGVVAKRAVFIGQKVAPNQILFSVINLSDEWIDVNLKESQLKKVKIGQQVELISDVNEKTYKGFVTSIGAGSGSALSLLPAQNATGNWIKIVQRVPVRVDFDKDSLKENGILPIGTSVRVKIDVHNQQQTNLNKANMNVSTQKTDIYKINDSELQQKIENIVSANTILK